MARRPEKTTSEAPPGADQAPGCTHPRRAAQLFGHREAERRLARSLNGGTLPHALILGGPAGVGKATLAYRLAKAVLAPEARTGADDLATDHEHPAIRRVLSEGHGDLLVLRRASDEASGKVKAQIPVDAVRRLHGFFGHHASEGGWRVAMIDKADDLNRNAANALLKILEEPPERSLLVLLADAPSRLLPTIRSRCRRVTLSPLDAAGLTGVLRAQGIEVPDGRGDLVARLAGGSPGAAAALLQGDVLALYEDLAALILDLPRGDTARFHAFADRVGGPADDTGFTWAMALMERMVQRLIRVAATGAAGPEDGADEAEALGRLAALRPLDAWLEAWDKIAETFRAGVPLNLDRRQMILSALFTLQATARAQ